MDGYTLIDAVVLGVLVLSGVLAYARGLMREVMSIVGWIVAAIVAFIFAKDVAPLVKEIPGVGSFLADSCELTILAAFTGVFAVALVIVSFFTPLLSSLLEHMHMGRLDRAMGLVFGILRGMLLVAVALVIYNRVVVDDRSAMVENSVSARVFANTVKAIEDRLPQEAPPWIAETYEDLMAACPAPAPRPSASGTAASQ